MSALAAAIHAARRRARRDEGGYLLIYVLGIIGLTSVLVIALLGLALTSAKVAAIESQQAREARAADGALESLVADIASRGGDVCGNPTDWPRTVDGSPDVSVDCTFSGVSDDPDAKLPGPDVEIVGTDAYAGGINPVPSVPGVSNPSFVVRGSSSPATFSSDVFVQDGAAPARSGGSPAVDVAGQYEQAATVGGGGCGALGTPGPNQISDAGGEGQPSCGGPVTATTVEAPYPADGIPSVPTRPMTCPNVSLAPGRYSPTEITRLNDILGGSQSCTVVFEPGVHYLDVFDPARTGDARNSLTISNRNVRVIGGVPTPTMTFPNACESGPTSPGVQIVLSARSAVRHIGGNVALCPMHQNGGAVPVLRQSGSADTQPQFVSASSANFSGGAAALAGPGGWSSAQMCAWTWTFEWGFFVACNPQSFDTTWRSAGTGPLRSASAVLDLQERPILTIASGPDDPGSQHAVDVRVRFTVTPATGPSCTTDLLPAGRSYGGSISYDLLNGSCASVLTNQNQIDGAHVSATFSWQGAVNQGLILDVRNMRIETNSFDVRASGPGPSDAAWGSTVDGARVPDSASAQATQNYALQDPNWLAGGGAWAPINHVTRTLTLNQLSLPSGLNGSDRLDRLAVKIRGPVNEVSFLADPVDGGLMKVELVDPGTGAVVCSTGEDQSTRAYGQSNQYLRFDLISPGNCGQLQTASQLQGLRLRLSYRTGCALLSLTNAPVIQGSDCAGVPIPKVDSVSLSVGTNTVTSRPPYSSVSVDTSNGTSFDVFGPVVLPRSDLDVRWVGTTSWLGGFSRPIFEGKLQVHGLGVDQIGGEQGVVCCVAGRDAAVLVARVDGEIRAQAAIRVNPAAQGSASARRGVEVLSWKICGRNGC
ncbi:hypothetical protein [Dermatobacter hominis]|uniref:hypothetical protein n=1 Tax=Dermatobacter hominis TaxID=2884263 RepID=UPI001D11D1C5|nr:hypothetical protein [Dermatobacter hominis]UDY37956.1 hypothetical protein LH044_10515 [Dermatobacter hominis]